MLSAIAPLLLLIAPSRARRIAATKSVYHHAMNQSTQLDTDATVESGKWRLVPNLPPGPALPIPDHAYGVHCPFQEWYPEIPDKLGDWQQMCLNDFQKTYASQGSPVGIRLNDHNYKTPLGQGNTLGFVKAKLTLGEGPDFTKYGLFAETGTLDAVIRFSDFGGDTSTNRLTRLALKIPLKSAWSHEVNLLFTETLDSFPIKNYDQLETFSEGDYSLSSIASFAYSVGLLNGGLVSLYQASYRETLAKHFYSQLPYQLGDTQAMKFQLVPKQKTCAGRGDEEKCCLPAATPPSNETEARQFAKNRAVAIAEFLSKCDAAFDLQLQVKGRGAWADRTILHCGTCHWWETPVKVGTLTIPKQDCDRDTSTGIILREKLASILDVQPEGIDKMFTFHPIATHRDNRPLGDISTYRAGFYSHHAAARYTTFEKDVFKNQNGNPLKRAERIPFDELLQAGAFN